MEETKEKQKKNAWNKYDDAQIEKVMQYNEGYKKFLSACKTERECVKEAICQAEEKGYKDLKKIIEKNKKVKIGRAHV